MSLADFITASRMIAAPLLLVLAVRGAADAFLGLAMYGFLTDAGDGTIARLQNRATARGARLDSCADLFFYTSVLAGLIWLFPTRLSEHVVLFVIVSIAYATPIVAGWLKFRRLTSYHTLLARVSVVSLAVGLFSWLLFEENLPMQAGAVVLMISAVEELAITRLLPSPRDNIATVFSLLNNKPLGEEPCIHKPLS